jgi:rSAM/selenodomain-associated transferase 2
MISVIIPTYNEQDNIAKLVLFLRENGGQILKEIIVSDGGSTDKTLVIATQNGARTVLSSGKGRAAQMNYGASMASGDILYFVHADTFPPALFCSDIEKAMRDGFTIGRYQTKFDSKKFVLKLNAFFTRFDLFMCYGGDQTLFVEKKLFESIGGFDSSMRIMEDYEIIERAKKRSNYKILPGKTLISARKYETNSWWRVQRANYIIVQMYKKGADQEAMVKIYKELLKYR